MKEIIEKINSQYMTNIFAELYGEQEIENARQRYTTLVSGMDNLNTNGNIRLFSAPGRTELAGNHTDHNRGKVLAASIQMDCAAAVLERNDNIVFFRSAGFPDVKIKLTKENGDSDLQPKPEEAGKTDSLIRGIAAEFVKRGFKINGFSANAHSTVQPGSGLSSSAAIEVLIGCIFDSLYGGGKLTPLEIAQIGQIAENVYFEKPCGLMDQTACASGGAVAIDFKDTLNPKVKQINFDLSAAGFALCVVNTGGSHADLTDDYASIPKEMKDVAAFFGKSVLREIEKEQVISGASDIRKKIGDRALLRCLHFFNENERVDEISETLIKIESAATGEEKQKFLNNYLYLINESGNSSWEILQNVYSLNNPKEQGISLALALTKEFFQKEQIKSACRVHGGGFAGTIQSYIPLEKIDVYCKYMETVFGKDSVTVLKIRPKGVIEIL
ncbi:MAG: galactokinase [Treponema sp.]|nr:galactokinase [Treponema sp.]